MRCVFELYLHNNILKISHCSKEEKKAILLFLLPTFSHFKFDSFLYVNL